ncbi:MAG TPA: riboflavin biosynthesis protein RibF [Planctomycetes bacterium]|nr:riboflavin biosynthesis protein RibF [Planctomycetota bacterium]
MEVIESLPSADSVGAGCALTIGNFDGVHLGHQRIITEARRAAGLAGANDLAVMTFEPHPATILHPQKAPQILTPLVLKKDILQKLGVDLLIVLKDSFDLLNLSPADFVDDFLMKHIGPKVIIEGPNFNFGYGRSGNARTLKALGAAHGFEVIIVPAREIEIGNSRFICSSSGVRSFLEEGTVANAKAALGRCYRLMGHTVSGRGIGRQLGFATVNIEPIDQIVPAEGVYAGFVGTGEDLADVCAPGRLRHAAVSIGRAKTFVSTHPLLVEAHILEEEVEDLSDKWLTIDFVDRIRTQQRFESKEKLAAQIAKDCEAARQILAE